MTNNIDVLREVLLKDSYYDDNLMKYTDKGYSHENDAREKKESISQSENDAPIAGSIHKQMGGIGEVMDETTMSMMKLQRDIESYDVGSNYVTQPHVLAYVAENIYPYVGMNKSSKSSLSAVVVGELYKNKKTDFIEKNIPFFDVIESLIYNREKDLAIALLSLCEPFYLNAPISRKTHPRDAAWYLENAPHKVYSVLTDHLVSKKDKKKMKRMSNMHKWHIYNQLFISVSDEAIGAVPL